MKICNKKTSAAKTYSNINTAYDMIFVKHSFRMKIMPIEYLKKMNGYFAEIRAKVKNESRGKS